MKVDNYNRLSLQKPRISSALRVGQDQLAGRNAKRNEYLHIYAIVTQFNCCLPTKLNAHKIVTL